MSTTEMTFVSRSNRNKKAITEIKKAITENKKAELDKLSKQVITAGQNVEQLQAIVTSLTAKSAQFTGFLNTANDNKIHTLANKNTVHKLGDTLKDLVDNCKIAVSAMDKAKTRTNKLALVVQDLINKLIYSAELINKLSNIIIRQKALNPLISDDLIDTVGTAGKDANNAVALTLVALESTFACQASNVESNDISVLDYIESVNLYTKLTGTKIMIEDPFNELKNLKPANIDRKNIDTSRAVDLCLKLRGVKMKFERNDTVLTDKDDKPVLIDGKPVKLSSRSLLCLIDDAYDKAAKTYDAAYAANVATTNLLNNYTAELSVAQAKLKSLQSGLAAANAAALAS